MSDSENLHLLTCTRLLQCYPSLLKHIEEYYNNNPNSIKEQDETGWTAIHFATFYSRLPKYSQVLSVFLSQNTKYTVPNEATGINDNILDMQVFNRGLTPLHLLALNVRDANDINNLNLFIENGANVNIRTKKCNSTALHFLIEEIPTFDHYSPVHQYIKMAIKILIKAGTHLRLLNKQGHSVLHLLAMRSKVSIIKEIIKDLIDSGVNFFDIDQQNVVLHFSDELQEYLSHKLKWDGKDKENIDKSSLASKL